MILPVSGGSSAFFIPCASFEAWRLWRIKGVIRCVVFTGSCWGCGGKGVTGGTGGGGKGVGLLLLLLWMVREDDTDGFW
jgi:hypothetical protein